jgi:hypothetical protein
MDMLTEKLLAHLPICASKLLLGVTDSSNPHCKKKSLRKIYRLFRIFEPNVKVRDQMVWHVSRHLFDCILVMINAWGWVGDDTLHQCPGSRGATSTNGKMFILAIIMPMNPFYIFQGIHYITNLDMQPFLASQIASVISSCSPSFLAEIREWQRVCSLFISVFIK